MATRIWPTDGADGSVATEFRWRAMARTWRMSGILPEEPLTNWGEFQAVFTPPNVLNVNPGAAWVDGHFVINEDILELPITDPGLAVLHVDPATNSAAVIWKAGGGASAIQDPFGIYELPICRVNGGMGFLNLGLPKPLVAFPGVVIGSAQYYHPSGGGTWYNGVLNGYQNAFQIFFPLTPTNTRTGQWQNQSGAGGTGTGVPQIPGALTVVQGAALIAGGWYATVEARQ
jgi:hypothetical protein